MLQRVPVFSRHGIVALLAMLATGTSAFAQGALLPGAGPVNRSMGGAAVAAPLDAAGSLYWNPATMSGLKQSEVMFGTEFIYGWTNLSSSLPANAFGKGSPAFSGTDRSDSGVFVMPTIALVYKPEDSPLSYGMGIFTLGGFSANFPGDKANPVLSPPPPQGFGAGPLYSRLGVIEVNGDVAYQVTEKLSIGAGPRIASADLQASPAFFSAPFIGPGGTATYPAGTNERLHWGLGFQAGAYWHDEESGFGFGGSYKSPMWFEKFAFNAMDPAGNPETLRVPINFPQIISLGFSYTGIERLTLATDVRWIDYHDATGFGTVAAFNANGSVAGIGWRSVISVAAGAQYQMSESLSVRVGYLYADSPIPQESTFFNLQAPTLYEHALFLGSTLQMTQALSMSMMYFYSFPYAIEGAIITPAGAIPGSGVRMDQYNMGLAVGMTVKF